MQPTTLLRLLTAFLLTSLVLVGTPDVAQAQLGRLKKKAEQAVDSSRPRASSPASPTRSGSSATTPSATTSTATPAASSTGTSDAAVDIYVSPEGNNRNDGSKGSPMKNIDKALEKAPDGARIHVAEGVYRGTFGVGYWEIHKPVELYGGYSADFSDRDPFRYLTVLQPPEDAFDKSSSKNLLEMKKALNGCVIDGFVFEGGLKTPYDPVEGKPEGVETGMMRVGPNSRNPEGVMVVAWGNNHVIRNNVFVNSSYGGVRAMVGQGGGGDVLIENNVFVSNRMVGIEGYGRNNDDGSKLIIEGNTILFTWSRLKDFLSFGYGIRVQKDVAFHIRRNIIGLNIGPGISSQNFNTDLYIDGNLFFGNKKKDFWFNPGSNVDVQIDAAEFADLDIPSAEGNVNENTRLPLDPAYLTGFINAQYSEDVHYDENSQENLLRELFGLNKRGTIDSQVTMYANRYPWQQALALVGAVPDYGVQAAK